MQRYFVILIIFFVFSCKLHASDVFADFFERGAVRYDFELVGNFEQFEVIHKQTKFLSTWGGNPNYLIEELNYGAFRYEVFSLKSNMLIFKKHMSMLAFEWQTTDKATLKKNTFYQAVFFPRPIDDVKLVFQTRDELNNWHTIFEDTIVVSDYFILSENEMEQNIDTIIYNGESAEKIDLLILSEGYTVGEMEKFILDSKRLSAYLFSIEPFKEYGSSFNVKILKIPSLDSGADIPGERIYRNTHFNSSYYTFDSPRYLTTMDMKTVYDAVDGVEWDQLYLLVNEKKYGGGGFYNTLNLCSSDNESSPFVFCHEFGHGFAGLGDEYYQSSTPYELINSQLNGPWEPNLTAMLNFDAKWKSLVDEKIPIPTPRKAEYLNKIGVFEGGGYLEKGIYSPSMTCWMKESRAEGFCEVCKKAIIKSILLQTK